MDPFSLFKIMPNVDVDVCDLERRYRALQLELHPDRLVALPPIERRLRSERSVQVNKAFVQLKSLDTRIEALYAMVNEKKGVVQCQEETTFDELESLMETREALLDAKMSCNQEVVVQIHDKITSERQGVLQVFA